ncbi:hypothetical protein Ancab_004213 [Ancistrocladus abbreviatus]
MQFVENLQFELLESWNLTFSNGILCIFVVCSLFLFNVLILEGGSLSDQSEYRKRAVMSQEEQNQMYSNSGSGGEERGGGGPSGSSKKMKPNKIPQRGLGIAKLERLREERQRKDAENAIFSSPPTVSPANSSLAVPFLSYPHHQSSSSSLRPPYPANLPSPKTLFRPAPCRPNIENFHRLSRPPLNQTYREGFHVVRPPLWVPTSANYPKMWHPYKFNQEGENSRRDRGLPFSSNMHNSPTGSLPDFMPKAQSYQQSPSWMNASSMDSSLLNVQMEPPSNQRYYNTYGSLVPVEERMVGMKRPYPFPLENPPGRPFLRKFPPVSYPATRSGESTSCGDRSSFNLGNAVPVFRAVPPHPRGVAEPSLKIFRENTVSSGEFLTLAPPRFTLPHPSHRFMQSSVQMSSHNPNFYNLESLPYRGNAENQVTSSIPGGSTQRPFFRFLPPAKVQEAPTPTDSTSGDGGAGEGVDLNLKL